MSTTLISKKEKDVLANITELTPENQTIIKRLFAKGISTRQIYLNLPKDMRSNLQLIELCIMSTNQQKLALDLITQETGIDKVEILKIANKYHPAWVAKYLKTNRIDIDKVAEIMAVNPEIYKMLASSSAYTQEEKDKIYATSTKWVKDGEPIQYIELAQNVRFRGRADYLKFVQTYIQEDASMIKFCGKYSIDKEAFNKVLGILSGEDKALGEQIEQVKERASQRYMAFMARTIDQVVAGETTIGEIIQMSGGRINGWDFINSSSFIDKEKREPIVMKMISEIDEKNKAVKRRKMDARYELPQCSMELLSDWFDTGKGQPIQDIYNGLGILRGRAEFSSTENRVQKAISHKLESDAKIFGGDVSTSRIVGSFFEMDKNTRLTITNKILEDALTVIKAVRRVPSHRLAILISKDILQGKLPESQVTEAYRIVKERELQEKGKQERRQRSMAHLKTVDEYITYVNTLQLEPENGQQQEDDVQE